MFGAIYRFEELSCQLRTCTEVRLSLAMCSTAFHPNRKVGLVMTSVADGKSVLLLRRRPTGPPMHEGLHLLLRQLAILVAVHRLENPSMRRLKFLQ